VQFISFAKTDKKWLELLEAKSEDIRVWDPEHDDIKSFLEYLSEFDVFLTARDHGAVFASILGKPVVCIGIEEKLCLIAELLGAGARLWEYPFQPSRCEELISDFDYGYTAAVRHLKEVVQEQGKLVVNMVKELEVFKN